MPGGRPATPTWTDSRPGRSCSWRWATWPGHAPDRPYHRLAWAEFHRQTGNIQAAHDAARQALAFAAELHDCTQIMAAHRLLGELAAVGADEHFSSSLALAALPVPL